MATEHTLLTLMAEYSLGGLRKEDAYWINCGTSLSVVASVFMLLTKLFQLQRYKELDNWHQGTSPTPVFLNRRAADLYRAMASIIPGSERFSWNLSF